MTRPPFTELYFGLSDAKHEIMRNAAEFVRSYVDLDGAVRQVVTGNKTLVLGPKGTGKSALAVYLEQTGPTMQPKVFARQKNASRLPLAEIPQIKTGQPSGFARTYSAWKFILLANYVDVALKDPEVKLRGIREIRRVMRTLREWGFITSDSGQSLIKFSGATFAIDKVSAGSLFKDEIGSRVTLFSLLPYLESWAVGIRSPNRHVLLLDGLDSIFLNDERYDESISGLMQACYDVNMNLMEMGASGSIVLLIRNDIFNRISLLLPDAHKMRDFTYDLDWRILSGAAGEHSPLLELVSRKASRERVQILDYFPSRIGLGRRTKASPRLKYLLNLTRHTPRDLLSLMEHIRTYQASLGRSDAATLGQDVIREGVLQYSSKYFVSAMAGELAGYEGGEAEARAAIEALKLMDRSRFTRSDFRKSLELNFPGLESKSDELLKLFFYAGALGNLFDNGGQRYMVFYHRRDDVELKVQGTLVLHNALVHAWSRKFGMRP